MSYFYTQSHVQLQPSRGIGIARPQVTTGFPSTRDEDLAREADKLSADPGMLSNLQRGTATGRLPQGVRHVTAPGFSGDNPLEEPPLPKRLPRVRPGVSEDELRKIWCEDERKVVAAKKMEQGANFVDRMCTHATSPLTTQMQPPVRGLHVHESFRLDVDAKAAAAAAVSPMGFKGMGGKSHVPTMHGRRAPTEADFAAPAYVPHQRTAGRGTGVKPKDTFVLG